MKYTVAPSKCRNRSPLKATHSFAFQNEQQMEQYALKKCKQLLEYQHLLYLETSGGEGLENFKVLLKMDINLSLFYYCINIYYIINIL